MEGNRQVEVKIKYSEKDHDYTLYFNDKYADRAVHTIGIEGTAFMAVQFNNWVGELFDFNVNCVVETEDFISKYIVEDDDNLCIWN